MTDTETPTATNLPDAVFVLIFSFLGGGNKDPSKLPSMSDTITLERAMSNTQHFPVACKKWNQVYNKNQHVIIAPLLIHEMEFCTEQQINWLLRSNARVGYFVVHLRHVWRGSYLHPPLPMPQRNDFANYDYYRQEVARLSLFRLQDFLKTKKMPQLVDLHVRGGWDLISEDAKTNFTAVVQELCPLFNTYTKRESIMFFQLLSKKRKRTNEL